MNKNLQAADGIQVSLPISYQKRRAMTVFAATVVSALWVLGCTMPQTVIAAGSAPGTLTVSVSVSPSAAFKSKGNYSIGARDFERGAIEIPIRSLFSVNAGRTVPVASIEFQPRNEMLRSVAIKSGEEFAPKEVLASDRRTVEVEDLNLLPPTAAGVPTSLDFEQGRAISVSDRETAQPKLGKAIPVSGRETDLRRSVSSALLSLRFNRMENARAGSYAIPFVVSFQL